MKMKTKTTHQADPFSIGGVYVFVIGSFFPAPPIPPPPVQIKSIKGTDKCDEDDRGVLPPPPSPPLSIS